MDYKQKRQKAKEHARKVRQKQQLYKLYHSNDKEKKPWTFTKKLTAFMLLNCLVIEIYVLVAMWHFMDISSLAALIAAVIGECSMAIAYMAKSTVENRSGGIVYEAAMKETFHLPSELTEKEKNEAAG